MDNNSRYIFNIDPPSPWFTLLFLVMILIGGLFVGQLLGILLSFVLTEMNFNDLVSLISPPLTPDKKMPLLIMQGMGAIGGFITGSIIYLHLVERFPVNKLFTRRNTDGITLFLAVILVISFMFVNTFFIEWNANVSFPDFLGGFEEWAREKEQELKRITEFLTVFDNFGQFILGFFVIAVLPAFGEELVFRGIIQNKLHAYLKNAHIAIWLAAILFSGFHIQFFGFIPRLLLGVLFGYMYYWSKNLWYPIIGHFINNGLTLTMMYLYQTGRTGIDVEREESYSTSVLLIFAVITIYMLFSFRRKVQNKPG